MAITFSELGNNGRLGNQIWQMITTICLALNNNDSYIFPTWKYEPYFNLHGCFTAKPTFNATYTEPYFHYAAIPYQPNLNLNGYFQSWKYMIGHEDFIRKTFSPNYSIDDLKNVSSLHVRRGDYLHKKDYHTNLDMDYYDRAMSICNTEKYYIFSDDIDWCRQNFIGPQFEFMSGHHETLDLAIMSKCANNIIAASSFSWWGAWLNQNPNKKVVAPQRWFGYKLPHNTQDLCPPDWIRISA